MECVCVYVVVGRCVFLSFVYKKKYVIL